MRTRSVALDLSDEDAPVFVISVAARLAGMHPQTLRTYDRMGLVSPRRARGRGRLYSRRDVARLRLIQRLSQEEGINLPGIDRILQLQAENEQLRALVGELAEEIRRANSRRAPRVFRADGEGSVGLGG
ncbi:heat shock protein transcriptional repressor HspR [Naumannella halotolerans]|uniref:MerR family transcriptional regulator/heat shock protein HspR n=1 Tax=Naumannella halotolerans TaxID=993414 RepID=A0A4R7JCT9_9ACTN|nr:helix-turn-helix transcriptional regulator [Naumannella halotolerans]TDT34537.1 MerR family transcriptional regulator/heat shock protein HspR [Naumannella halotolerans]